MNKQTVKQSQPIQTSMLMRGMLQRKCGCGQHTMAGGECETCNKKRLQRRATNHEGPATVPPIVHEVLRSPGQPLDTATRSFMEPRFGQDFSHVRLHTDSKAAESASAVDAVAYTVGRDIVLGAGQYDPRTTEGRMLLAHELTHVAQQRGTDASMQEKLVIGQSEDMYEREADQIAAMVMQPAKVESGVAEHQTPTIHKVKEVGRIQRTKGLAFGMGLGGALVGGIIGGLLGGVPGAIIGGLIGGGIGALLSLLFGGSKIKVDNSCKNFCPALDVEKEAAKADNKATAPCKNVKFTYQVQGAASTSKFDQKIDFNSVTIKCDKTNANCGGWSSKGIITLGQAACNAAMCGPMASTILHEMIHDWAGWGPPYDKKNVTVPGATHTTPDYLDEWIGRYLEKDCFGYDPWGLP